MLTVVCAVIDCNSTTCHMKRDQPCSLHVYYLWQHHSQVTLCGKTFSSHMGQFHKTFRFATWCVVTMAVEVPRAEDNLTQSYTTTPESLSVFSVTSVWFYLCLNSSWSSHQCLALSLFVCTVSDLVTRVWFYLCLSLQYLTQSPVSGFICLSLQYLT